MQGFEERVAGVAALMRGKNVVLYIGAGASASSGVPTFRGTNRAESLLDVREDHLVFPNFTHRACAELLERGMASSAVSSNHDGLLSGDKVVEIFGSVLTETCLECKQRFRRRFAPPALNRTCACDGKLKKTGCRYGQTIYKPGLDRATAAADSAEVALVLGSGMHTWPLAAGPDGFPMRAKHVVLVTLGETAADGDEAIERFDCTCDEFMRVLMQHLAVPVAPFVFEQRFSVAWKRSGANVEVTVSAADPQETLAFAHEGSAGGEEFERSQFTHRLSATVPGAGPALVVRLRPREAFGPVPPLELEVALPHGQESGEAQGCFRLQIPDA
jgi:NAD-dependent deacetylase